MATRSIGRRHLGLVLFRLLSLVIPISAKVEAHCDGVCFTSDLWKAHAVTFAEDTWDVAWGSANPDHPVMIQWRFALGGDTGRKAAKYENDTNLRWEHEIKQGSASGTFRFQPSVILEEDFANEHTNISGAEALAEGSTHDFHVLGILQPDDPEVSSDNMYWTQPFAVETEFMRGNGRVQEAKGRREEKKTWALGVGVGVGVGVPTLLGLVAVFAYRSGKKSGMGTTVK